METIFKALALVPIGYILGPVVYLVSSKNRVARLTFRTYPINGILGVGIVIIILIGTFIKYIDDYPKQLYIISTAIGMTIYGIRKLIKDYGYLLWKPRE